MVELQFLAKNVPDGHVLHSDGLDTADADAAAADISRATITRRLALLSLMSYRPKGRNVTFD